MRYIKKYNENAGDEPKIDIQYMNNIFAEFIDNGANSSFIDGVYIISNIIEPKLRLNFNLDDRIQSINQLSEFYSEIKTCINRIKDEYPNISCAFSAYENGESNAWVDTIKTEIKLSIYYAKN